MAQKGLSDGNLLIIDTVSQNRQNIIKTKKYDFNFKIFGSRITSRSLPPEAPYDLKFCS